MTNNNQKKEEEQNGGANPVLAAVTGAVVGAVAVGVAGAAILANDRGRKQVEKVIDDAKDNVANMKSDVQDEIAKGQEKLKEVTDAIKASADDVVKSAK
jgi:hypothetical protein